MHENVSPTVIGSVFPERTEFCIDKIHGNVKSVTVQYVFYERTEFSVD